MKEIKTFVTEKLGIKYPIIAACMQWISKAELVAAVEALPEAAALPITSPPGRPPAFLCALLDHRRGDHGA